MALASADEVLVNGTVSASGVTGGNVAISGNNVGNFGTIAANGTVGDAGSVRIDAANAVALGDGSLIAANAGANGNGGTVEVIAQNYANLMAGSRIEAKGGAQSGNGGFVETSGYKSMNIQGRVDTTAANGEVGTWLIDPSNITITDTTAGADTTGNPFTPTADGATIAAADVVNGLGTADVEIKTTNAGGSENGKIVVEAAVDYSQKTHNLTLTADNDITVNAEIKGGDNGFTAHAANAIDVNAAISAGTVELNADAGGVSLGGAIKASSLTVTAGGDVSQSVAAEVGTVSITVADGKNVSLDAAANKLGSVGVVGATDAAGAVKVVDSNGDLALTGINAASLDVEAAGKVTQTAVIDVGDGSVA